MDRKTPTFGRSRQPATWLLIACLLSVACTGGDASSNGTREGWGELSSSCTSVDAKNTSVSCYGVRIVRKIVQQIMERSTKEPNIEIFDGVSLVEVPDEGAPTARRAKQLKGFGSVGTLLQFLEGRELRIKLPSLLPQNVEAAFQEGLAGEQARKGGGGYGGGGGGGYGGGGGGGGGKKGGGGGYMILALMMGKMMAAMGLGTLGVLAMKALMVSAMAMMLSIALALKKLVGGGDDGGGHHVVYAQEVGHHHRRRRSLGDQESLTQLPYRGYAGLYANPRAS